MLAVDALRPSPNPVRRQLFVRLRHGRSKCGATTHLRKAHQERKVALRIAATAHREDHGPTWLG